MERPGRFDVSKLIPYAEEIHERLQGTYIECLPYHEFISKYDRAETLFYLDPPYWGCENDYGKNIFEKADFEKLAKQLKTIRGKFILSLNDVQQIRQIFKAFHIKEVQTKYTITINAPKPTTELLISNVDLDRL